MINVLEIVGSDVEEETIDRPAWIPSNIVADWDPCPYAYQTEEELMSQGMLHDVLMTYISQVMPYHLEQHGLTLWKDLFLLYRNSKNIKNRIGPDLLLAESDLEFSAGSWDLDEMPIPQFLGEITSPKSRKQDLETKGELYHNLGVSRYLVIDGHDAKGKITGSISIRMWLNGKEQSPGSDGFLEIPELKVKVKPLDDRLVFYHTDSLEPLLDMSGAKAEIDSQAKEIDSQAREIDIQTREIDSQAKEIDSQAREIEALKRKLREMES